MLLGRYRSLFSTVQLLRPHRQYLTTSAEGNTRAAATAAGVAREWRFFPRRAVMYVPACEERKTRKAASLRVDSIVLDLEDGVAANQKASWELAS